MQGFTGVFFAAIAAVWLVYLVPTFLHRNSNGLLDEIEPGEPLTASATIIRRGEPLEPVTVAEQDLSTPTGRAAALQALHDSDHRAARRRLIVVSVLSVMAVVLGVGALAGSLPWAVVGLPVIALGGFLAFARTSVVRLRAELDAEADRIRALDADEALAVEDDVVAELEPAVAETSIDLSAPVAVSSSLWDPIPITAPTYVSKPLAPRTVRVIDLSAPVAPAMGGIPVTADDPESFESAVGLEAWAVNE